ncbi:MAG: SpoIIE family protein phosphatase [Verrucomicrobiales bacterium]
MTDPADCFLYLNGQRLPCHAGDVIGREGTVARDVLRPIDVLSRRHLAIDRHDGQWQLTALPDARNETYLDGAPMIRGRPYPLVRLQSVRVDAFEFHLGVASGSTTQFDGRWASLPAQPPLPPPATSIHSDHPNPDGQVIDVLPVAALETDARLSILAANAAAVHLLGGALLGRDLDEWAVDPTSMRSQLLSLDPGGSLPCLEVVMKSPEGDDRRLELAATRLAEGMLVLCRDVTAAQAGQDLTTDTAARLAFQIKVLAELSLAPAFADGDVAQGFTLLTHRAASALECRRASVWIGQEAPTPSACRIVRQACFDSAFTPPGGMTTDMAYCPRFFDPLASSDPLATAEAGSPVLDVLREIGFVAPDTTSVLCVGLRERSGLQGVLAFERADTRASWTATDRQFACCLASHAMLAMRTAERQEALVSLQRSGDRLTSELEEANRYVQRILPERIEDGPITAEWVLQPSEALGGDSFGYHWVGDLFVMYILDVVGHGTGMALLSISVLNNVRARLLLGESAMADPAGVLGALNAAFPMENQNNMLFSLWYGVFDRRTRVLTYASAGHPPAILLHGEHPADEPSPDYATLGTEGPSVGAMEGVAFSNASIRVSRGSKLFLFTDGAFEIPVAPDREWTFEEFIAVVRSTRFMAGGESAYLRKRIGSICSQPHFPDDFTIVRLSFED